MSNIQKTELLYMKNSKLFEFSEARVLAVIVSEDGPVVVFDKTIFYPQGGGQPSDRFSDKYLFYELPTRLVPFSSAVF
jgi:alanyl-tRNA synthetase